jgi:hypothetical protein
MQELRRKWKVSVVYALALGCALLAGVWPQWRDELQGYGTYGQLPTHSKPYIKYCYVLDENLPAAETTGLHVAFSTPDMDMSGGSAYMYSIGTYYFINVVGPNSFSYDFTWMDSFLNGECSARLPNPPLDGLYTFTVSDSYGNQAKSYYYLTKGTTIPPPDVTSFKASSDASGVTLSWSAISGYNGNLSYRVKVYSDAYGSQELSHTTASYLTTSFRFSPPPSGAAWTVEAFDQYSEKISNGGSTEIPPISFTIDNTLPYFNLASVYTTHSWTGGYGTGLWVRVGDPSGTLSSLTVSWPNGSIYSFDVASQCSSTGTLLNCYGHTTPSPTPPEPAEAGLYTFKAGNDYGNATSSYYRTLPDIVPVVDSGTCRASGNETSPVLSWSTPETADRPLYYQVWVYRQPAGTTAWQPGGTWSSNTSIKLPSGTLPPLGPGESYQWWVNASDNGQNFGAGNVSFSAPQTLTMNPTDPYFTFANVHARTNSDGKLYIFFDVQVSDPDGTVPTSIASVKVKDPDSVEYDLKGGWDPAYNEFYIQQLGTPKVGKYTFTVRDTDGHNATTYKYHRTGDGPIPTFDENSIQVSGTPLAPTISWGNIKSSTVTGYPGRLYYIVQINDQQGNLVYNSSWSPNTYAQVPPGKLLSGKSYQYRVRAQDANNFMAIDNRVNSSWHLLPTIKSDFNLDGKPDLIWRNMSNGMNLVWYMNGAAKTGDAMLNTVADINWAMVGTADFNGDGKPDLLWRNTATGMNVVWYMDGATRIGSATLNTVADPNWRMVGTTDFNGDGYPDILWRNTATGMNLVWYMGGSASGPTRTGVAFLKTVPDLNWVIVGTADFNGDGKPDILWKNTSLGMTVAVVWYMDGVTLNNWSYYNNGTYAMYVPGQAGLPWNLVGLSDVDGDGYPDTIWRNTSTGANRVVHTYNYYNYAPLYSYFYLYDHYFMWTPNYSELPTVSNLSWNPVSR